MTWVAFPAGSNAVRKVAFLRRRPRVEHPLVLARFAGAKPEAGFVVPRSRSLRSSRATPRTLNAHASLERAAISELTLARDGAPGDEAAADAFDGALRRLSGLFALAAEQGWSIERAYAPASLREATAGLLIRKALPARAERLSDLLALDPEARFEGLPAVVAGPASITAASPQLLKNIRDFALHRSSRLVRDVGEDTRRAIRRTVEASVAEGLGADQSARRVRQVVGLRTDQIDRLSDLRDSLFGRGLAPERVESAVDRQATQMWRDRARMIARTEIMDALQEGKQEFLLDLDRRGLIDGERTVRRWIVTPDDALCPICEELGGLDPVAIGDPFESSVVGQIYGPPSHPNCRCDVASEYVLAGG